MRFVIEKRIGEILKISDQVTLRISGIHGDRVRIGIDAPKDVIIDREEVHERKIIEQKLTDTLVLNDKLSKSMEDESHNQAK